MGLASKFGLVGLGSTLAAAKAAAVMTVTADFLVLTVNDNVNGQVPITAASDGFIEFGDAGQITFTLDENTPGNQSAYNALGASLFDNAVTGVSGNLDGINFSNQNVVQSFFSTSDAPISGQPGDQLGFSIADDYATDQADLDILDANAFYSGTNPNAFSGQQTITSSLSSIHPSVVEDNFDDTQNVTFRLADTSSLTTAFYDVRGVITITDVQMANVPEPSTFALIAGTGALALAATRRRSKENAPTRDIG